MFHWSVIPTRLFFFAPRLPHMIMPNQPQCSPQMPYVSPHIIPAKHTHIYCTTSTMYLHTKIYSTHEFTSRVIIIVGSFGRMIQLNGRVFRHLENVTNFRVWGVALGSLLQLMNLLHLQVFHGSHMAHQGRLAWAGKLAECAVVRSFFFFNGGLHFLQVSK